MGYDSYDPQMIQTYPNLRLNVYFNYIVMLVDLID